MESPSFTGNWPPLFQVATKIQNLAGSWLLLGLLKGLKNGMSQPQSTKTHKEYRILGNGLLPDQGPRGGSHEDGHLTKWYNFCPVLTVKIWPRFTIQSKVIQFIPTDRHILHPYRQGQYFFTHENLYLFTWPRSFICFAHSFVSFVNDKRINYLT